ncbi:MAG TPA: GNAT family N-acetyltransferase, partial [Ktedonobacterales bacterium]
MDSTNDPPVVENNTAEERYEARVDGSLAFLTYEQAGDTITYFHTEVPPALSGRGVGGALARAALDEA